MIMQLLASEENLNAVIERILQQVNKTGKDAQRRTDMIRVFLEENGKELGLPSSKSDESVALLYDEVFTNVGNTKSAYGSEKDDFRLIVKEILENFAEQLDENPVFQELND